MSDTKFGNFIKNLRLNRNLSLNDVSNAIYVHRSTYSHYEKGDRVPPVEIIIRLSNLYRVNPMEFFYTLVTDDVKAINQSFTNFKYTNLAMYTRTELQFMQDIAYLSFEEQAVILNTIKLFKNNKSSIIKNK